VSLALPVDELADTINSAVRLGRPQEVRLPTWDNVVGSNWKIDEESTK
jgi:hypothetical protein